MDKDTIKDAVEEFGQLQDHWSETRECMMEDLKFARLGEQWDEKIAEDRAREGRPVLTINKCPSYARQIVNEARQNKPSIRINPADDNADVETAEIMNGIVRNIEYTSNAKVAYDTALESAVYTGMGFWRVELDYANYDSFDMDIKIARISNPLSVYGDPSSTECDASDWNVAYVTEMMLRKEFERKYPDADPIDFKGDHDEEWRTEDDVRIAERWLREEVEDELVQLADGTAMLATHYEKNKEIFDAAGLYVVRQRPTKTFKVTQQILTAADVLDEIEWPGRYIPIVPVYGEEFTVEGKRYFHSMFRHAKDAQRMFNYWRTASTELVALAPKAPFIGPSGAFDSDEANWATANSENHPYLEYDGDVPPQRQPPPQIPAGAIQETQSADMDIKSIIGIHDPGLGINPGYQMSGKAVREWKVESDMSNFHFLDNLSRSIRYTGRVILDLIPHVYSEARVTRIMGADGKTENVPVMQEYAAEGSIKMHDFSKGKYDLIVDTGPSYTTQREETREAMQALMSNSPELTMLIGDVYAKALDWEGAEEVAKRLKAMLPPQIQALENMKDVPEEARVFIAQAQGQVKQLEGMLQQKDMIMAEMDQAIKDRDLQLADKSQDNQLKARGQDINLQIAQMKEDYDVRLASLESGYRKELEILKARLEQMNNIQY